ncbi:hypothetical protein [Streptococcus anginosus]|uniref:hypothetical protein n=1 Tax=Streptococcus anginosus TaxID=1328 RepID=UPI0020011B6D|nr:hypothetical protein [Streptococcus anginosus]
MNKVEEIIQSIEQSKATDNHFAMLTSSLVLIDICSSIEYKGQRKKAWDRYQSWIDQFLLLKDRPENTKYLDATNIWHLRCAMLHEGATNPNTQDVSYSKNSKRKVKDLVPVSNLKIPEKILVGNEGDGQIMVFFDIGYFVDIVLHSAKEWVSNNLSRIQEAENTIFSIGHAVIHDGKVMIFRKLGSDCSD